MLLACQGFVYDGPQGRLGFSPVWRSEDHTSFFTAAEGWGLFSQKRTQNQQDMTVHAYWGQISLQSFEFDVADSQQLEKVTVQFNGETLTSETSVNNQRAIVLFENPFILQAPDHLEITAVYE